MTWRLRGLAVVLNRTSGWPMSMMLSRGLLIGFPILIAHDDIAGLDNEPGDRHTHI